LYGFVGQDGINRFDVLGLITDEGMIWRTEKCQACRPSPPSIRMNSRNKLGQNGLDLFTDVYILRGIFEGYDDNVWRGILASGPVSRHVSWLEEIAKGFCPCKTAVKKEVPLPETGLTSGRESMFSLSSAGLNATVAIGSAELTASSGTLTVTPADGKCAWEAHFGISIKDLYSFKSYNDDWSQRLPWYTRDNNLPLRILTVHLWGRDFYTFDGKMVTAKGEVCCE
jgi:hypothetical protein